MDFSNLELIFGKEVMHSIAQLSILVVGAGGIGCELLKNLVLCGIKKIDVVDLDTIDVTNLNRQFLFRREHVGLHKSTIASSIVAELNKDCKIESFVGNIMDKSQFPSTFFSKYHLILNALDNYAARQYINRQCLDLNIPLIESGSNGWAGQMQFIYPHQTECFECIDKPKTETFPVCTIRSTPEKIHHCIAYGKLLFEVLLSEKSSLDSKDLLDDIERLSIEVFAHSERKEEGKEEEERRSNIDTYIFDVLNKLFSEHLKSRTDVSITFLDETMIRDAIRQCHEGNSDIKREWLLPDADMSIEKSVFLLVKSLFQFFVHRPRDVYNVSFQKDDADIQAFICGASNIRAHNFGIPLMNPFNVKAICNNIIPAIASTNAIVAGLQSVQLINFLRSLFQKKEVSNETEQGDVERLGKLELKDFKGFCQNSWILPVLSGNQNKAIVREFMTKPRETCHVCSQSVVRVSISDPSLVSVEVFVEYFKSQAQLKMPCLLSGNALIYDAYEAEEDEGGAAKKTTLADFQIEDRSQLELTDYEDANMSLKIIVHIDESVGEGEVRGEGKFLEGVVDRLKQTKRKLVGVNEDEEKRLQERQKKKKEDQLDLLEKKLLKQDRQNHTSKEAPEELISLD